MKDFGIWRARMEEMRDGRMDGSKDGWKAVRDPPRPLDSAAWLSPGT